MATINLILNAIDKTSGTLKAITGNATVLADRIDDLNSKIDLTSAAMAGQAAAASRAADSLNSLTASAAAAAAAQDGLAAKTAASGVAARLAYGGWGLLLGRVALFGGLATVGGLHLALDVVAEIAAVALPAAIALGAFGVAASDAVNNVIRHFTSLHTVMDATGQAIYPLSGALEKLHEAVQPAVYEILGDALLVANSRMGELQKLAMGTGQVLDQLAARASVALESSGVSKFLQNAIPDVAKLGDVVGNIFGIIGNLLRTLPGYAEALLNVLDGLTRGLEAVTANSVVQDIIGLGLAFHGLFLYAGLAATATILLGKAFLSLGAKFLATDLGVLVSLLFSVGSAEDAVALASLALDAVNPLGWAAIAAAALAGLVFWLSRSKTSTQEFTDALQANINSQQTWTGLIGQLSVAQGQTFVHLQQATEQLSKTTQTYNTVADASGKAGTSAVSAYQLQQEKVDQLRAGLQQFNAEQSLANSRVQALGKQVGGTQIALGLMSEANIKAADAATATAGAWKQDTQQVLGLQAGLRAMADYAAGNATTSLQVLDNQATDQYAAIQKVNSAWDTFTSNMTSTQGSFDTAAQGFTTLSGYSTSFTLHLGRLSDSITGTKAAIDSLTPTGIALNQAFSQQISNVSKLYDSWRTANIANNLFTQGVKASIAPLLVYANGSQEATDQLVGLAEQAGYKGPASLKALTQWLGNTGNATQTLKNITDQATQQEALLTGAMNAQGKVITGQLIGDINQAILKYDGVQKAAANYGQTVAQFGADSSKAHTAQQVLINDLIKSGQAAGESQSQIAAMIATVLQIPASRALQIVMTGEGTFSISQQVAIGMANIGKTNFPGGATGGYVSGPGSKTSDSVLARLSAGEYVVKAAAVDKYGSHMMDAINTQRFAGGGLVLAGNRSVLSGQYAVNAYNAFSSDFAGAMISSLRGFAGGGLVTDDPFLAGRSVGSLSPATPLDLAPAHSGPLFTIQGDLVVRDEADATLISQKLSAMVRMASLGGGFR